MADAFGECFGILCSCCCICSTASIEQWCLFKRWGSGSSTGGAGCCTSCCKRSFDDDDFEREERKLQEERLAREAAQARDKCDVDSPNTPPTDESKVVSTQPTGAQMMSPIPRSSGEGPQPEGELVKNKT
ncbi:hypothetical protein BDY19DRAFT_993075 [Irpex rosettiformis]|uniref:Uncharacterized protein n=1 Tax=Irpex rosettiformis TaxID=378272 RepID=A0ACB8U674_9APHY|nr:hypothetical protein BDY19DRAFT_993075 [Irpex rosettiformis]